LRIYGCPTLPFAPSRRYEESHGSLVSALHRGSGCAVGQRRRLARGGDVQASDNPISITAHVGYSDIIKAQRWMPVSIAITNTTALWKS
jgi:hypothetical protein